MADNISGKMFVDEKSHEYQVQEQNSAVSESAVMSGSSEVIAHAAEPLFYEGHDEIEIEIYLEIDEGAADVDSIEPQRAGPSDVACHSISPSSPPLLLTEDENPKADIEVDDDVTPALGSPASTSWSTGNSDPSFNTADYMDLDIEISRFDSQPSSRPARAPGTRIPCGTNGVQVQEQPQESQPKLTAKLERDRQNLSHRLAMLKQHQILRHSMETSRSVAFETLEFFGDSELEYRISHLLQRANPSASGNALSSMTSEVVKNLSLAVVYDLLNIGTVPNGHSGSPAAKNWSIIKRKGDVVEAIVGELIQQADSDSQAVLQDLVQFIYDVYFEIGRDATRCKSTKNVISKGNKRVKLNESEHAATDNSRAAHALEYPHKRKMRVATSTNVLRCDSASAAKAAEGEHSTPSLCAAGQRSAEGWLLQMIKECNTLVALGTFAESDGCSVKGWMYTIQRVPESDVDSDSVTELCNSMEVDDSAEISPLFSNPAPVAQTQAASINHQLSPAPATALPDNYKIFMADPAQDRIKSLRLSNWQPPI